AMTSETTPSSSRTLADRLRSGPLSVREATQICRALLSAIESAHARGAGYGDIRANTVVLEQGRPVLAPMSTTASESPAADVYAVATLLYEAVSGRSWTLGMKPESADWSGIPRRLRPTLRKALSTSPEPRPLRHRARRVACGDDGVSLDDRRRVHPIPVRPLSRQHRHSGYSLVGSSRRHRWMAGTVACCAQLLRRAGPLAQQRHRPGAVDVRSRARKHRDLHADHPRPRQRRTSHSAPSRDPWLGSPLPGDLSRARSRGSRSLGRVGR